MQPVHLQAVAVVDTTVLITLQAAGLLEKCSVLFERILVPTRVREELLEGGELTAPALKAIHGLTLFENCDEFGRERVDLLLQTRPQRSPQKDRGEAEAVIQAAERSVTMVLVEDKLGRSWATGHSLESHGALWICKELRRRGFVTDLRTCFMDMLAAGRYQPLHEMNRILSEFDEPTIERTGNQRC